MIEFGIDIFGSLTHDEKTGRFQSPGQRLREIVEEVKLMDDIGIDFFAVGEHHRADYAVASPEILLAALAPVTRSIKLSSAVSVLSSADPVKLYQDFATVDLLSGGRAEIMAGRGSFIESFPLFGYDLEQYHELFEEKLQLLVELNKGVAVSWKGTTRAPLHHQTIFPQPDRKLPVWVAVGGTPESVIRAAKLGLPVMFAIIGGSWMQFKPLIDYYRKAWTEFGNSEADFRAGVHLHSFFGENIADEFYPQYAADMDRIGRTRNWPPYRKAGYDAGRAPNGHLVVGNAAEATEKILNVVKGLGLTRFSAHLDTGAPTHKQMMTAIEMYGRDVLPALRAELNGK